MTDIPRQNLKIMRGDDWGPFRWTATEGDLTGSTLRMTIKRVATDADPGALQLDSGGNGIVIVDALNADFSITHAQSALLAPGNYVYDVQQTTPSGKVYTGLRGQLLVEADITLTA